MTYVKLTDTRLPLATRLAAFAGGLHDDDVPDRVRERAAHLILDAAGIALAASTMDFAHRAHAAMAELSGGGPYPAIGFGTGLSLRDGLLLNGLLVHGLDYDDTHPRGVIHATASAFPTAFAMGWAQRAGGAQVLTAYVAAMEVATRLGAVAKGGFHQIGFHPTGVIGIFGAVMAAGRLRGLSEAQLAHAQGIALSQASGSMEFLQDGAWTKRMHPGWAGQSAVTAVTMARHGFVGPAAVYEGRFGFFASYLGRSQEALDLAVVTDGLGETWEVEAVAVKPLPACHFTHACADAAMAIHAGEALDPDEIESVVALVPQEVIKTVCEPRTSKIRPQNGYDAQFSIPYAVASGLLRGRFGLVDLEPDAYRDPSVLAVAEKVEHRADPDTTFPAAYSGEVVVRMRDGRVLRHREAVNRGAADRPLSAGDIEAKFFDNAHMAVSRGRAVAIRDAILGLDGAGDVRAIARLLAGIPD